ncbi:MAG: response regulator transcription factor [Spirochaetales bacterium]|nr:response regulator transcription factor [Spirochaetales bacterium]
MVNILIIEDEPGVQMTLEDRLQAEGYGTTVCGDGHAGETEAMSGKYDLILLDLMLPGKDGFSICQSIRKAGNNIPVLMLTARNTDLDTVMGLRVGGDDYLPKPFDMGVLLARIEALLRRSASPSRKSGAGRKVVVFGEFRLDRERGSLMRGGLAVELNAQEYRLLDYLSQNEGRILGRDNILDDVWGYNSEITTRTVDVHVAKLRARLGESEKPRHIITYRGRGYKFELEP